MQTFAHGDKLVVNGCQGTVFELGGYCAANGYTAERTAALFDSSRRNGHELAGVIARTLYICNDREHMLRENAEWTRDSREVADGETVEIAGTVYRTKFVRAGVTDFAKFIPV